MLFQVTLEITDLALVMVGFGILFFLPLALMFILDIDDFKAYLVLLLMSSGLVVFTGLLELWVLVLVIIINVVVIVISYNKKSSKTEVIAE
ncbi:MAG: hypothetical protein ACQERX_05220 [Bacillota bacterium]